jgi:hypothetical protein
MCEHAKTPGHALSNIRSTGISMPSAVAWNVASARKETARNYRGETSL